MKMLFASQKIYIAKSNINNAGRGVFAITSIKKGIVIENCPVIQISEHDMANLKESLLVEYFFFFDKNNRRLLVALGFGSIYNHSQKPNAKYKIKPAENTMEFIAIHDIKKGDEITIHYNALKLNNKTPLWFEVA